MGLTDEASFVENLNCGFQHLSSFPKEAAQDSICRTTLPVTLKPTQLPWAISVPLTATSKDQWEDSGLDSHWGPGLCISLAIEQNAPDLQRR